MPKSLPAANNIIYHRVVVVAGLVLIAFCAYGLTQRYQATHDPQPLPPGNLVVSESTRQPDEAPVKLTSEYKTAADVPRIIRLPTIGAEGFIQKVGIDQHGAVGVPTNISLAGWYALEKKPGDAGVSLIDGHVQGVYNPGILKNLSKLKVGDRYSVEFGDTSLRQFEVVSIRSFSVADVAKHLFSQEQGITKQLNLITCGGTYNKQTKQYENRVLAVSKLVQ